MNKVKVLITDDEADLGNLSKLLLEEQWDNYDISVAYSGTEALSVLENEEFDILITDIRMPGMNGIELMRKANEIQEDIYTIVTTGHEDINTAIEAMRLGASNYLKKPVHAEQLHFAVINAWEKKELNRKLRESEAQFRSMFEHNSAPMLLIDPETASVINANMAASEFYGYSLQELTAMKIKDVNMLLDEKIHKTIQHVRSGEKKRFIFPHRLKNGQIRRVEVHSTPLEIRNAKLLFSIIHDVEDRIQAEKSLKESEIRYRTLFDNAGDAIFVHDFGKIFLDVNRVACERLGYTREELMQMRPDDIVSPAERKMIPKRIEALKQHGHIVFESEHVTLNREFIPFEASTRIIEYGGKSAIMTISRDLRERKKAEEEQERLRIRLRQAQKMESLGTLAGGIAHDFNNILSPVIGYTELAISDAPRNSEIRPYMEEVLKASYRATDLVQQILAFSRQTEQERGPLNLQYIVKEVLKLIRASLPSTIEILENIDEECGIILADSAQMHQVIMNLCTNAYHAMLEMGGVLTVTLGETEFCPDDTADRPDMEPGAYLKLIVSDTGHGMDTETMGRIFDPYFTTKDTGKGTGLGLSVVHGIIRSHGGHISVYSEPDSGSAFHIFLPVSPDTASSPEKTVSEGSLPGGKERILLVDDEVQLVDMERHILERLGYSVTVRTSSVEAFEAFRSRPDDYDLVITDMTMPNMTGLGLSRKIMQIRPNIPIILCTGFSELITEEKAEASGIRKLVMKPMLMRKIAEVVREVLD
ncbi:response regulator [Desulfococcaceae bacterium HSG8]|nr:response regulator [Desulfococcaceae bacterium HSG8]